MEFTADTQSPRITAANRLVLDYIETTFKSLTQELESRPCGTPAITLKRISCLQFDPEFTHGDTRWRAKDREMKYCFPGKNENEARRFTMLLRVLAEIYEAIQRGVYITKREIYYKDPELFGNQAVVDRFVDDVAHTCQVTRRDLNVTASPKGLVAGLSSTSNHEDIQTIPPWSTAESFPSVINLKWILVVEKEATFKTLVETQLIQNPDLGRGLIVTGKGYPDLASRYFLRSIIDHAGLHDHIFGLFDADPDGINIFKTYCSGSKALAMEYACNVPEIQWLGLGIRDVLLLDSPAQAHLNLTNRDRTKARSMLKCPEFQDLFERLPSGAELRNNLQIMLMLNLKAEIQWLESLEGGLSRYIVERMKTCKRK